MDDAEAYEYYADPANRVAAGPPTRRQGQRLTAMSSVRFDPAVIEAVKERASEEEVTVGSWIRRLVSREIEPPRMMEIAVAPGEHVTVRADVAESLVAALMPAIIRHGAVSLQFGTPRQQGEFIQAHRDELEVVPGSGRPVPPRLIPSSLQRPRSFACQHMSIGSVVSASCGTCGPLPAAA